MQVPFQDLKAVNNGVADDFLAELKTVLEEGQLATSQHVQKFEETFARFIGNKFCMGVGSGSDGLLLALRALGVGPGDEVICPAFGSIAPAESVVRVGATPVFVDVRADSYTIDPDKALASITSRTKAVIPSHLYGHCAEIDRIVTVARTYTVSVIEDVRDAVGARNGHRRIGTYGEFGVHSFAPTAPLGGIVDGGAVTTNNEQHASTIRKLRDHGRAAEGVHEFIGYSSMLDAVQAMMLLHKLQDLDENNSECIESAGLYSRMFAGTPVVAPSYVDDGSYVYNSLVVMVPDRDKLLEHLKEKTIGCGIPQSLAVHLQPCFAYLGVREGSFPIAEDLSKRALALPVSPGLKKRQIQEVAETVLGFYGVKL